MRVFLRVFIVFALLSGLTSSPQVPSGHEMDLAREPHHRLILQTPKVRVFRLGLQPNEATLTHAHNHQYGFLSLSNVAISNEVRGRAPVITQLSARELHTSKGGFSLVERNTSHNPAEVMIVERMGVPAAAFAPHRMAMFPLHSAFVAELFENESMRAYELKIAAGGFTEPHDENFDRLILALTDSTLEISGVDAKKTQIDMKAGDVRWFPKGTDRALKNAGRGLCSLSTFEFN